MKILILNTSENIGGAAIAANRLMKALLKKGIDVKMFVRDKQTNDVNVFNYNTTFLKRKISFIRFIYERAIIFINNRFDRKNLFRVSLANAGINIGNYPIAKEADIIHLHWINQNFLSLKDIENLTRLNKPIIWTMHDMWECTGICHHARECDKYKSVCASCFYLNENKKEKLSTKAFNKKKKMYQNAYLTFVGCSKWLTDIAKQSDLCKEKPICSIPNPIDICVFRIYPQKESRLKLDLPLDKKLLLFGAYNITDEQKGIGYLLNALKIINVDKLELIVFGNIKNELQDLLPFKIHSMGYINDEKRLVALYNAVDIYVTPSLEENLPNTIMEAMACGTPCIGFNVGGIPEMIDHKINGYVAIYKDIHSLADGITWVLENLEKLPLSQSCVEKVRTNYSENIIANKYISLYKKLLNN